MADRFRAFVPAVNGANAATNTHSLRRAMHSCQDSWRRRDKPNPVVGAIAV